MTVSANLHRAVEATATKCDETEWLTFKASDGSAFHIFMPFAKAEEVAAVFNAPEADRSVFKAAPDLLEALERLLHDVSDLAANSEGVAGLHMNGNVADWGSLLPGGEFGAWLASIDAARAAIAKARGQA